MKRRGILGGMIAVVLAVMMALALGTGSVSAEEPTIIASGDCGKDGANLTWTLDSTGLLTISGEGEMESYSSVNKNGWITTAPWQNRASTLIIQKGVTSIGGYAFYNCGALKSVTIPDSVTSIGDWAFEGCNNIEKVHISDIAAWCGIVFENYYSNPLSYANDLYVNDALVTDLTIPNGVTSIGSYAFKGCTGLTSVTIGNGVTSIGYYAFSGCTGLTSVEIPNSVTSIGSSAFYGCTGLTSVTIPDSVTSIGGSAFSGCTGLTSVTIPDSVTSIGGSAFSGCTGLTSVTIGNSVTSIGDKAFSGCTGLTSVTIPDSVTSIGGSAFSGCTGLTSMTIPDSVTSMGVRAFSGCTGLTCVSIGNSVTSIGGYAFEDCSNLTSVYFNANECADFDIGSNVFCKAGKKTEGMTITFGKNVKNIPGYLCCGSEYDSYTKKYYYSFVHAPHVKKIIIGDGVQNIGRFAFYDIGSLTEIIYNAKAVADLKSDSYVFNKAAFPYGFQVQFGDGVERIPAYLFYNCTGLTSVTIPDSVTSIGSDAFYGCTGLTSVTIPDSVTSIGSSAFSGCTGLTSVTIPDSVTSIGSSAFSGCTGLTGITFPDSVTSIGYDAFSGCTSLTSVTIPDSVTSIGGEAFSDCTGLTSVTIPDSVTSVGFGAFEGCTSLTSVTIGNSVDSIGTYAFRDCAGLTSVTIPDSVTSIGGDAFYNCTGLTSVTIGNSVTSIGDRAFYNCTGLTEIIYNAKAAADLKWDSSSVFYNAGTSAVDLRVVIGDGVERIPAYLFYNCTGLTSVTIGNNVTSIENGAFLICTNLTSVTIGNSVTSIGNSAFSGCTDLTKIIYNAEDAADLTHKSEVFKNAGTSSEGFRVVIGDGVKKIPSHLFYGCTRLSSVTIGNGVTSIGRQAFYGCNSIEKVHISDITAWCEIVFEDYYSNPLNANCLYVNDTLVTNLTIPNDVTSIGTYAFHGCTGLTSVTIPDSVTNIGTYAFHGCTGLTSVKIGNGVTSIGERAFTGCTGLTSVTIPDSVTSIGEYAFRGCKGLTSVTIGNGVSSIGDRAFEDCTGLTSVTIPDSVTSIGSEAFSGCSNLTSVYFNAKECTDFKESSNVFSNAGEKTDGVTITFGKNVQNIPSYLCYGSKYNSYTEKYNHSPGYAPKVKEIIIENGVQHIGNYAFYFCTGLTSVTIPDSVTSIGSEAFCGCSRLTSVTIGTGVARIGDLAFRYCRAMTELKYNAKAAMDVSANAFQSMGADSDGIDVTFGKSVKKLPRYLFPKGWYVSGADTQRIYIRSITFTGDAPVMDGSDSDVATFGYLDVCAFYPYQNETWTPAAKGKCSHYLKWHAYSDAPVADISCKIDTTAYLPDSSLDTGSISMTLTHEDGCVETIPYNSHLLELGSYDMSTTGEKVIDVTYKGHTAQLKVYVHEKKAETLDKTGYPESSHDYENNLNKTYTYKAEGAFSLDVTFSAQTEVETNIDYLYVNGTKYTGTELAGKTLTISGDTLTIRLVSDKSDSAYGFSIDSIVKTYMGHEYEDTVVPPTCTEQGYTLRSCPCGSEVKQNYVDALGHDMVTDAAVAPTCMKTGLTEGSHCSRCDEATTAQKVVPALGHDMVTDAAVAPTCMKTGLTEGSHCSRCDEATTTQKVVPALGHDMVTDAAVAPTCTKTGLTEGSHCIRCDGTIVEQKVVPALGHDTVTDAAVAPTCTKTGLTEGSHCGRCGEMITEQKVVPALGHDMVTDAAVAPTCTKTGLTEGSHCSRCDDQTTAQEVIPARGHRFNARHICRVCGVEDPVVEITLKKLPTKASYVVNKEALDVAGGVVLAHYESGETEELNLTAAMVSGFDNTVLGKQTLTVTVGGLTTTFEVEVVERAVTSVTVENGKLVKHYTDGTTEETPLKDGAISDFAISETGEKTLTLTSENACVAAYKDADGNYVALKAVANEDGSYSYVVPEEVTEVTVAVKGDLDGDGLINMKDLARLRHDMADGTGEDGLTRLIIDLDGDGIVNMKDMGLLRRYLAGGYDIELGW